MKKLTTEQFIEKAKLIRGNIHIYDKVEYNGNKEKIEIICRKHGSFWQRPDNYLNKKTDCPKCSQLKREKSNTKNIEYFIKKLNDNKIEFTNIINNRKIELNCKKHGSYVQNIYNTLNGSKCPKCAEINRHKNCKFITTNIFIERSKKMHGSKYNYDHVKFIDDTTKVRIICPKHGIFEQVPYSHMSGNGCPKCKSIISKPEIELQDFIKSLGFKIKTNNRKILNGRELDIYIPELKKAIEFNGTYWHYSKKHFTPGKHAKKSNLCKEKGIKLLHIREDLWLKNKEYIFEVIKNFLN